MNKMNYQVIGMMSGTSLDGIDLCYVHLQYQEQGWKAQIKRGETIPYSPMWEQRLREAVLMSSSEVAVLNVEYTQLLVEVFNDFIARNQLVGIDAICSHGHTVFHRPELGYTLQIGNLPELARGTQQLVVCDFRVQDVLLGGQGAPLVPMGDLLLFADYDGCLNLGGFANLSFTADSGKRLAFDIVAVNTVLNHYANSCGLAYDDRGTRARKGQIDVPLLTALNQLEFYDLPAPKSLGIEMVHATLLPMIDQANLPLEDRLCTFVEHVALQIAKAIPASCRSILATGGGVYHDYLIERLRVHRPLLDVVIPAAEQINYKEALVFALLGVLKLENQINVLASVTGASTNHSSGRIFHP
ncbi:anhydro-N-acetylmuramic acid kinase [Flavobacterium sp. JP2137]|uniref:anhydro-N-acetylmuramic acid kinase n=1 Tax=Flavobacterium sp. JP2137 TaxID=3414510 RepID=UPI003D2FA94F